MITVVILAVVSLVDVAGTIIVRILVLPLTTLGIIVDITVIVVGAVMTIVGTVFLYFPRWRGCTV